MNPFLITHFFTQSETATITVHSKVHEASLNKRAGGKG